MNPDPLQQAREALGRIAEAAPDEPDLSHGDGGFEAGTIARTALQALPESLGERPWTIHLTDDEHTRLLGWAYMIRELYKDGWDELDEALSEAIYPDPSPKGASE